MWIIKNDPGIFEIPGSSNPNNFFINPQIGTSPKGDAILAVTGPGRVWLSEMVGSGEIVLTARTGAIPGTGVMWAIILGIFLKFWIGSGGARYTVCTGEGVTDIFDGIPGPIHWVIRIVPVIPFISATVAIGIVSLSVTGRRVRINSENVSFKIEDYQYNRSASCINVC